MKLNKIAKRFLQLLGMLVVIVAGHSANAQVQTTSGDLILAFRTTDNSIPFNLEVDLGQASQFVTWATNSPGVTFNLNLNGAIYGSLGGLSAVDLRNVYGDGTTDSSWNSFTSLVWSVAGKTGATTSTALYTTFPAGTVVNRASGATQNNPAGGRLGTLLSSLQGQTSLTSPEAAKIATDTSSQNNYTGAIRGSATGNKDYAYFTPSSETAVVSSGFATLDLFQFSPTSTSGLPGTDLGTFKLGNDGTFTFTAAAAVPEPSTYAALVSGTGLLLLMRRHRRRVTRG